MKVVSEIHHINGSGFPRRGGIRVLQDMQHIFGGDIEEYRLQSGREYSLKASDVTGMVKGFWTRTASIEVEPDLSPSQTARAEAALAAYKTRRGIPFAGYVALRTEGTHFATVLGTDPGLAWSTQQRFTQEGLGVVETARATYQSFHPGKAMSPFLALADGEEGSSSLFIAQGQNHLEATRVMVGHVAQLGLLNTIPSHNDFPTVFGYGHLGYQEHLWERAMKAPTAVAAGEIMVTPPARVSYIFRG